MALDIYLNFPGNCREVIRFYADVFGVETGNLMTFGDVPPHPDHHVSEEAKDLIMHARLDIDGTGIMFTDAMPGTLTIGNNVSIVYNSDSTEKMKAIFEKLSAGGNVTMELQATFWSKYYGMLTDKFGTNWMFNHVGES